LQSASLLKNTIATQQAPQCDYYRRSEHAELAGTPMASIKKRVSKTGSVSYQAQVRMVGHPPQSKNFDKKRDAITWAAQTEAGLLTNTNLNPTEKRNWTIPEVIDWYFTHPDETKAFSTKKHFNRLYFLREEFSHWTVETLTPDLLKRWITKRLKINQPSTVYHYYVALKNVLMHHSAIFKYGQDLFERVKCPTKSGERTRRFSTEETRILFKSIYKRSKIKKNEMRVTILFALETACRIGEMLQLKWSQVNLKNYEVTFLAPTTKTKVARTIPLTSVAESILKWIDRHHNPEKKKDNRVFDFFHLNEHHLSRQFKICCTRADIHEIRWHDLRHEATSRFYEKGNNLTDMEISKITGHKTLDMLKRYAHLRTNTIRAKLW